MIGHNPPPYPDELLRSIIARLNSRLDVPSTKELATIAFGRSTATAVFDLPAHVSAFVDALPITMRPSANEIIDQHTLWPFFAAFQSSKRRESTREEMKSSGSPYMSLGLMASGSAWSQTLKYCPMCVEVDRMRFGETYWHRVHQIPGIEACHRHNALLCHSDVSCRHARNRHAYQAADSVVQVDPKPEQGGTDVQIALAQSAAWLLAHPSLHKTSEELRGEYLSRLIALGYATYSGQIRVRKLRRDFLSRYPADWLGRVGCGLPEKGHGWLERLLRKPRGNQHPLRHLLLIHFLGLRIEKLLGSPVPDHPFGRSPWPCLNRAAVHYGKLTIAVCTVAPTINGGRLAGSFECHECGMTYWRVGPDKGLADRMRRDRIPVYGTVWDQALTSLWSDPSVSLRSLCRALGVDSLTARRQASRLGLPASRHGHRSPAELVPASGIPCPTTSDIDVRKSQWLALRAESPDARRTALRKANDATYTFLWRHAREWLELNSPFPKIPIGNNRRVNWQARDRNIAKEAEAAHARLRNWSPPVRATRTAIMREAGFPWVSKKKLALLPLTERFLQASIEDRVAFALRRIMQVSQSRVACGEPIQEWELVRISGLRSDLAQQPQVKDALQKALRDITGGISGSTGV